MLKQKIAPDNPQAAEIAAVKNVRNITFELCAWGFGNVETFGASFGHLWRTSMDVKVRCED